MASVWSRVLDTSRNALSGTAVRRPRIVVLGLDELSQSHELVSALLDDPLISDRKTIDALRNRHGQSSHDLLTISPGDFRQFATQLNLDLPWLKKMDVDVFEIPLGHPDTTPLLYDADVQILVTSLLSSPLDLSLQSILSHPQSFLVVTHLAFNQRILDHCVSRLTPHLAHLDFVKSKIFQVDPSKALTALDSFRKAPTSVDVIQTFQDDFLASGVTALLQSISQILSSIPEARKASNVQLALTGALEACHNAMRLASHESDEVQRVVDNLRSKISDIQTSSAQDILGGAEGSEVEKSVQRSTREMEVVMDAIPWWKLPFKVDDLSGVLFRAAEHGWCRDLQAKLEFHTGRLAFLRSTLISQALGALRQLPPSFQSAVLVNQLHQLSARPPELAPNTLTQPLSIRLQQLQQPILKLHRQSQRDTLNMFLTSFGSTGGAYAAWFVEWITAPTAMGLGALGFVVGLRWFVARWEKAKRRWWEDWRRVGDGLERDIKKELTKVVSEKVVDVPRKAANDLEKQVDLRLRDVERWNNELQSIRGSFQVPIVRQRNSVE